MLNTYFSQKNYLKNWTAAAWKMKLTAYSGSSDFFESGKLLSPYKSRFTSIITLYGKTQPHMDNWSPLDKRVHFASMSDNKKLQKGWGVMKNPLYAIKDVPHQILSSYFLIAILIWKQVRNKLLGNRQWPIWENGNNPDANQ